MAVVTNNMYSGFEQKEHYELPLQGRRVSRLYFDYSFGMIFGEGGPGTEIRIGGKIKFARNGDLSFCDPSDVVTLAPLLSLFRMSISRARALKDGSLSLEFEGGITVDVTTDKAFEAWELVADSGFKIVSMPVGDLAIWQAPQCSR
jgi:hypothetical protein